ncbi:hypothetical protein M409DRAFT_29566 [Zasmidium cellare ATCC 36951]|uniref:SnoaL-like domain-containing protein n=1 Tax=Zasmidium cellare ATCC 36951 TaxID=1080233 RepID=A0A6A6C3J3_ZASCE|nr:uncharacterized protein M409DRAFT_29566 [Zasmidium cellare ATCC 36951]KAF2159956.1 hypothetical protein M409DRAFT_29566 [Zasmidium cellare ATCC 36951]
MAFNPDEAAIVALLKRERFYRDTSQWDKLRSQYHPDAHETYINVSWFQGDADKFVEQSQKRPSTNQGIEIDHFIDPHVIEIRGHRAISDSAIFIKRPADYKNHEYELGSRLRALNRFLKVAGEWKIVSLEVIYIRDRLISTSPNSPKEPIVLDDSLLEFPREYRWMAWVMLMEGKRNPKKDLPRNGNIEEVRQMVARNEKFLEGG